MKENLKLEAGNITLSNCLQVISAAQQGKLSEVETQEQLPIVAGAILSDLYLNDKEGFKTVLDCLRDAAEERFLMAGMTTHKFSRCADSSELLNGIEILLHDVSQGYQLYDYWLDEDEIALVTVPGSADDAE